MKSKISNQKQNQQTLDVTVEKIVPGGLGLAFAEKMTVFVALAVPGERVRVRIKHKKGKAAFAEIVEILDPASERRTPPCPYFGICGGCDFQQLNYPAQLKAKAAIIRDSLTRIGKIDYKAEIPIIGSPDELNYRLRAQWHADSRNRKIGYFKRESHSVVDVEFCPILAPPLEKTLKQLRENLNFEDIWAETTEIEAAMGDERVSVYSSEIIEPTEEVFFTALGEKYFYDARSFFQGNRFLIEDLINLAVEDSGGDEALDLFCGVGLFSLPLAKRFEQVFGVEGNSRAVELATKNAERARIGNVRFASEDVAEWLASNTENLENIDFVLLDPPRAGLQKEALESLLRIKPREISYVSCDPATLARDLGLFTENLYEIRLVTGVDLFPQTHHIETVVRLKLKDFSASV